MQFFRLCSEQVQANKPLPWNVYNEQKQLLLHKGHVPDASRIEALLSRGMFVDQGEFDHHAQEVAPMAAPPKTKSETSALWQTVQHHMEKVLSRNEWEANEFDLAMGSCHDNIKTALSAKTDASLFELLHDDDPTAYTVQHALQCSFVCGLISERIGFTDSEKQTLTNASLTMNVGMSALQSTLAMQAMPPNPTQRKNIDDHGKLSRALLEKHGVTNQDWLRAVEQHHVTPDGSALPSGKPLNDMACIIHYVDVYLAKVSSRSYRPAIPAFQAMREVFVQAGGANNPYVSALVKELGVYPPGSCVRLANGELAVVVRKGNAAHMPWVRSLLSPNGQTMHEPDLRDTSKNEFKVLTGVPRHNLTRLLNRHQLFA